MRTEAIMSRRQRHRPSRHIPKKLVKSKISRIEADVMPRAMMVLGMHRSGTSAFTRIFGLLGADLPKNLLPPTKANKTGYWESRDLMEIHDEILSCGGSSWHDWRAFNPAWFESSSAASFKAQILDVLRKDFSNSPLFAIKDPRICRLWPLWRDVLREFGAEPLIVIPIRNPLGVAASLNERDDIVPASAHLVWLRHVLDAERGTRGLRRVIVAYEALTEDWRTVVATVASKLELRWPRRGAIVDSEIEQFLSPQLRHYTDTPKDLAERPEVVNWVKETYATLTMMAGKSERRATAARLDRIWAAFDHASAAFGIALAVGETELVKRAAEVSQLSNNLSDFRSAAEERELQYQQQLTVITSASEELTRERDRLAAALEEEKAKVARNDVSTAQELETLRTANRKLETGERALLSALEDSRRELAVSEMELVKRVSEVSQLSDNFSDFRSAAEKRELHHQQQLTAIMTASEELARDRDRLAAALEEEKAEVARGLETLRSAIRERETVESKLRANLHNCESEIERLSHDLDATRVFLHERQSEIQRVAGELDAARVKIENVETERQGVFDTLSTTQGEVSALKLALEDSRRESDWRQRRINELTTELQVLITREAFHTTALAENEKRTRVQVQQLRNQLIDAEAALAGARSKALKGPTWIRLLSMSKRRTGIELIKSCLFDAEWYMREYPDVAKSSRTPVEHYLEDGYLRGYRPNPLFDTRWYLERYEDVRHSGINPLLHYLMHGFREGRDPSADFQTDFYLEANPDVRSNGMNPLVHYLRYGRHEGRRPKRTG